MSLINDVLEDFHRRRVSPERTPGSPLEGVEVPKLGVDLERSRSNRRIGLLPWLFGVAGLTVLGVHLLTTVLPVASGLVSTPEVSARPPVTSLEPTAQAIAGDSTSTVHGTTGSEELYDVDVQREDGYTRVRFYLTNEREYWLQGDPAHGEIEVVITGTRLANAFAPHAFEGTGLQLQEAHNTSTGLHLLLSFEPATRVQSQVVYDEQGPALVLDVITAQARNESEGSPLANFEQQRDAAPTPTAKDGGWGMIQQTHKKQEPRIPEAYRALDRARALTAEGRKTEAIAEFIRALALDSDLHSAREALVVLLVEAGQFDAAARHVSAGMSRAPAHAEYTFLKAQVLAAMKQPDRAIAILESLPTPPERRSDALNLLAALYQQKGNHARAETHFRNAVQLAPHEARLWMGLGISLEGQQRKDEALAVYKQAESLASFETGPRRWLRSRIRELSTVE